MENKFLYHGTAENYLGSILENGIMPRSQSGVENFGGLHGARSMPDRVYLTDHQSGFYAQNARGKSEYRWLIAEVPFSNGSLSIEKLAPDEDFMGGLIRTFNRGVSESKIESAARNLTPEKQAELWPASLSRRGTIAYVGNIPVTGISRLSLYDPAHDPYIEKLFTLPGALLSEQVQELREAYQHLSRWLFGQPTTLEVLAPIFETGVDKKAREYFHLSDTATIGSVVLASDDDRTSLAELLANPASEVRSIAL